MTNLNPCSAAIRSRGWPWFTCLLAGGASLIHLLGWSEHLQLDRTLVAEELWRLFTGHLAHYSGNHLVWDIALWLVFGAWAEQQDRTRFIISVLAATVTISAGVLLLQPHFVLYRGLSGLDSTAFAFVFAQFALRGMPTHDLRMRLASWTALAGFLLKCAYETVFGATLFADDAGFEPVPLAHLLGGLCGAATVFAGQLHRHRRLTATAPARSATEVASG